MKVLEVRTHWSQKCCRDVEVASINLLPHKGSRRTACLKFSHNCTSFVHRENWKIWYGVQKRTNFCWVPTESMVLGNTSHRRQSQLLFEERPHWNPWWGLWGRNSWPLDQEWHRSSANVHMRKSSEKDYGKPNRVVNQCPQTCVHAGNVGLTTMHWGLGLWKNWKFQFQFGKTQLGKIQFGIFGHP